MWDQTGDKAPPSPRWVIGFDGRMFYAQLIELLGNDPHGRPHLLNIPELSMLMVVSLQNIEGASQFGGHNH